MSIVTETTRKVKSLFSSERLDSLAKETGLIKRKKKIVAKDFLSHHLCLSLSKESSIADLAEEFLDSSNIDVSKQAIHKKYTAKATHFMHHVLEELIDCTAQAQISLTAIPFIQRVKTVDSSCLKLNEDLAERFPGLRNQKAGIKLQTIMDVVTNSLYSLDIRSARENDQSYKQYLDYIESNDLSINDLGYFCVESFKVIQEKKAFFLSRFLKTTTIYSGSKKVKFDLGQFLKKTKKSTVEKNILLGAPKLPCRIVAIRLPPEAYQHRLKNLAEKNRKNGHKQKSNPSVFDEWTVFVTNLPSSVIPETLLTLYSLRWQIELFFKVIKTFLNLRDTTTHQNPHKALISIYSSLIAAVLLTQCSLAIVDEEISLYKAAKTFVKHIKQFFNMVSTNKSPIRWLIKKITRTAIKECTPKRPSTKQVLGVSYA